VNVIGEDTEAPPLFVAMLQRSIPAQTIIQLQRAAHAARVEGSRSAARVETVPDQYPASARVPAECNPKNTPRGDGRSRIPYGKAPETLDLPIIGRITHQPI
jgi:hypothetical protein